MEQGRGALIIAALFANQLFLHRECVAEGVARIMRYELTGDVIEKIDMNFLRRRKSQ